MYSLHVFKAGGCSKRLRLFRPPTSRYPRTCVPQSVYTATAVREQSFTQFNMEGTPVEDVPAAAGAGQRQPKRKAKDCRIMEGVRRANDGDLLPQKRFFRQRAHINPLNQALAFQYPIGPDRMDWSVHYPAYGDATLALGGKPPKRFVEVADVGCGFGGLLMGLSAVLPETLMLGMEIRQKVTEYVRLRILAKRKATGTCQNISVIRSNAMKYTPQFFFKGLLAEYAYAIRENGTLYTITDVRDLHQWMVAHLEAHPMFERIADEDLASDPCVPVMRTYTEEGIRVERNKGNKYVAVFRRVTDAEAAAKAEEKDFWHEPEINYEHVKVVNRQYDM